MARAVAGLNGQPLEGRPLTVNEAKPPRTGFGANRGGARRAGWFLPQARLLRDRLLEEDLWMSSEEAAGASPLKNQEKIRRRVQGRRFVRRRIQTKLRAKGDSQ